MKISNGIIAQVSSQITREHFLRRYGLMFFLAFWQVNDFSMATAAETSRQKATAMVQRMTIEEKIGQMTQVDTDALKHDHSDIQRYFLGSVLSGGSSDPVDNKPRTWLKSARELQGWSLRTRLKIPLIYGIDAVHGHNNVLGAVIFPHNIGLGATRNPTLVAKAARAVAEEIAGTGIRWTFSPCVAVSQDDRWGRTYESFGEAPDLVSVMSAAQVRGLQGDRLSAPSSVLACSKHFVGDGGTQYGIDQGNLVCDEATLRRIHLPPYASTIQAGVGSIMTSYSSWNGKKMSGIKHLITDVLKGELKFEGLVISDWAAIDQLPGDYKSEIETSINAGLDVVMIPNGPGHDKNYLQFIQYLKELVREGRVPVSRIDDAVQRVLRIKYEMGVFAQPFTDPALTESIGSVVHRQIARECVRQSLVLLKNENNALPLSKNLTHLSVLGKAADDLGMQCGGWTISWQGDCGPITTGGTTILEAIIRAVNPGIKVTFSLTGKGLNDADAVVVVIGEKPYAETAGDRKELQLSKEDAALVTLAKSTGKPVITVLLSGRPLILGSALEESDAFLAAWLPGTEGQGVADVLFGDCTPSGKLPHAWPQNNAQAAVASISTDPPLFPRDFGLRYQAIRADNGHTPSDGGGQ